MTWSHPGVTRRLALSALWGSLLPAAERGSVTPSEQRRFLDPATENELLRHTDPVASAFLPDAGSRPFFGRGNFLLYASDRSGQVRLYRLELRTGQSRLLSEAEVQPGSFALQTDGRAVWLVQPDRLRSLQLNTGRLRDSAVRSSNLPVLEVAANANGSVVAWLEQKADASSRLMRWTGGEPVVLAEAATLQGLTVQPRGVLAWAQGDRLYLCDPGSRTPRALPPLAGRAFAPVWSDSALLYLQRLPGDRPQVELREFNVGTSQNRRVALTSQCISAAPNQDGSVLACVSGSKASPYILLLLRQTGREFTLCEHRASDPGQVHAQFSSSNRRVFFQSDRQGKPAIYSISVEKLVEEADQDEKSER